MRVVGLDIGSYSIKAVELEVGFRHLEVLSFAEERLPLKAAPHTKEEVHKAITNLFIHNHIMPPFKLVTTLDGKFISSRFVNLPFKDKAKITMALPSELEDHIPFPMEDIIYDYQISTMEDNTARILTLMAPKDAIQERLDLFADMEVSPDLLTTCNTSLYNLTYVNWEAPSEIYAFVDIGHTQTSVCIIEEGSIRKLRTISFAGKAITEKIQKDYSLSYEEAEKAKIENGFILTSASNASQDQLKFSECIKTALEPVITQLNQTFQGLRSKGQGIVRKVILSGGTSLLRNIGRYLSDTLQVEVELTNCLNAFEMINVPIADDTHAKIAQALSLSLGYSGRHFNEQFNFRKEDFSKSRGGFLSKEAKSLFRLGTFTALILFLSMTAKYIILKSSDRQIQNQMAAVTTKFPIKVPERLLESPIQLRSFLSKKSRERKEKIKALGGGKGETLTALQLLKEISEVIPKTTLFEVREFTAVDRRVKMKALSDSFNSIDEIEKGFKANKIFTKITKGAIVTAPDGKNKSFTISFDIKKKKNR